MATTDTTEAVIARRCWIEGRLRVQGQALRWEELDEDIWVADAVLGRFPAVRPAAS